DKITPIIDEKQKLLDREAGKEINVNSSPQVKTLFEPKKGNDGNWYASDGTLLQKTPKGQASLGADALREIRDPKASLILEIRSLIKTRDTFLLGHVVGHAHGGRVYPTINQSKSEDSGTGTGRLSIQNPAMQQIPNRNKKIAAIVKPCFLPDEGMVWVDTDMASFEVRVFYHLINNSEINRLYAADPSKDAHQFVADLTGLNRDAEYSGQPNAKQLNLSMIFNSGKGAIAEKMGMPWEYNSFTPRGSDKVITYKKAGAAAEEIIAQYHRVVPGVEELAEGCKSAAERDGYIKTYTGRRLRFPNGWHSYAASGKLIQATSADLNKENWSIIEEELGDEGHLILNTHDSYSMCLPEDWRPPYKRVKASIERSRLRIPLLLDFSGVGVNW
ncbi:DNA polymerase I, partial [bacterium]|nr:DNA polymerase I [bacterium]